MVGKLLTHTKYLYHKTRSELNFYGSQLKKLSSDLVVQNSVLSRSNYHSSPRKIGNVNLYRTAKIRIIKTTKPQTILEIR